MFYLELNDYNFGEELEIYIKDSDMDLIDLGDSYIEYSKKSGCKNSYQSTDSNTYYKLDIDVTTYDYPNNPNDCYQKFLLVSLLFLRHF